MFSVLILLLFNVSVYFRALGLFFVVLFWFGFRLFASMLGLFVFAVLAFSSLFSVLYFVFIRFLVVIHDLLFACYTSYL